MNDGESGKRRRRRRRFRGRFQVSRSKMDRIGHFEGQKWMERGRKVIRGRPSKDQVAQRRGKRGHIARALLLLTRLGSFWMMFIFLVNVTPVLFVCFVFCLFVWLGFFEEIFRNDPFLQSTSFLVYFGFLQFTSNHSKRYKFICLSSTVLELDLIKTMRQKQWRVETRAISRRDSAPR